MKLFSTGCKGVQALLMVLLMISLSGCGISHRLIEVFSPRQQPQVPDDSVILIQAEPRKPHEFASFRYTIEPERLHEITVSKIREWANKSINKSEGNINQTRKGANKIEVAAIIPSVTPSKQIKTAVPTKEVNLVTPSKEIKTTVPSKEVNPVTPSKEIKTTVPSKEVNPVTPSKEIKTTVPSKEVNPVTPSKEIKTAKIKPPELVDKAVRSAAQQQFCHRVGSRLNSISIKDCLGPVYQSSGARSSKGEPIMISRFGKVPGVKPTGRVLLLGGTHGDELSSASAVFEWANSLRAEHSGEFEWHVVPIVNPDGLLTARPTRTNANGIDLNRNMPTPDWQNSALKYWRERAGKSPRKFPGFIAGSEPETRWLVREIAAFKPDVIISVHAPHNMIDYDAPSRTNAPRKLGHIKGGLLGTYPGSLGNYAGERRGIPVVTIELPDANKAIADNELNAMWGDLIAWLMHTMPIERSRFSKERQLAKLELN